MALLLGAVVLGCGRRGHPVLGSVTLKPKIESLLSVSIARSRSQPWRLRFSLPGGFSGDSGYTGRVSVFVTNDDKVPLSIYLGSGKDKLLISPSDTQKIFDGTYNEMFMLGRTQQEEMTILSSKERKVNLTFRFIHDLQDRDLEVIVSTWFLSYGP